MENELKYKIFLTQRTLHLSTTENTSVTKITQPCFDLVNEFKEWTDALEWRKKTQNFEGEYTIVPCY